MFILELLPIVIILAIVAWSYYASITSTILQSHFSTALLLIFLLHFLTLNFIASLYLVVKTNPGKVIITNSQDQLTTTTTTSTDSTILMEAALSSSPNYLLSLNYKTIETKKDGSKRYCTKCFLYKPDRSHHCNVCGNCILRMDHHCPWVANCIGFYNYKYFILFILYGSLYCLFIFITSLVQISRSRLDNNLDFIPLFLAMLSGVFGVCLLIFTGMHLTLIFTNKTTIESMEGAGYISFPTSSNSQTDLNPRNITPPKVKSLKYINIYYLGIKENWCQVMGRNAWFWFLPIRASRERDNGPSGDGHSFVINESTLRKLELM